MPIKVILAGDQELFRAGLQSILENNLSYQVSGNFKCVKAVLSFLEEGGEADLILLDWEIHDLHGTQLLGILHQDFPKIRKMVISRSYSEASMETCRSMNADGYIHRDTSVENLLEGVEKIINGHQFFQKRTVQSSSVLKDAFGQMMETYNLTGRELEILELILNQYENGEIAIKLNLSPLTIKTHRRNIFKKLKIRNLAGMVSLIKNHRENSIF